MLGQAAECPRRALPAASLPGPVSIACPRERDSGEEEELCSVASVTMATFAFVSLDPELLPHLVTGIQVRQRDGIRNTGTWNTKLLEQTRVHASWHREGAVGTSPQSSCHVLLQPIGVAWSQELLNLRAGTLHLPQEALCSPHPTEGSPCRGHLLTQAGPAHAPPWSRPPLLSQVRPASSIAVSTPSS